MTFAGRQPRLRPENTDVRGEGLADGITATPPWPSDISRSDVRQALHKILKSREFHSVVQLRAFLSYVVTQSIEDRSEEIKGYTIAVEALGRDSSFNPVTDPIVRVEAARLRRRLEKYYAGTGKSDPIQIRIPKGSYAPIFEPRDRPDKAAAFQRPCPAAPLAQQEPEASSLDPSTKTSDLLPHAPPAQLATRRLQSSANLLDSPFRDAPDTSHDGRAADRPDARPTGAEAARAVKNRNAIAAAALVLAFIAGYLTGAFL